VYLLYVDSNKILIIISCQETTTFNTIAKNDPMNDFILADFRINFYRSVNASSIVFVYLIKLNFDRSCFNETNK